MIRCNDRRLFLDERGIAFVRVFAVMISGRDAHCIGRSFGHKSLGRLPSEIGRTIVLD
jgi:hypothetical protein